VFLSALASAQMSRAFDIAIGRNPVNCLQGKLCKAAREHLSKLPAQVANSL
jgi:hypothetical protein